MWLLLSVDFAFLLTIVGTRPDFGCVDRDDLHRATFMPVSKDRVLAELKSVTVPDGGDIVSLGMVRALTCDGGTVSFVLEVPREQASSMDPVRSAAERVVRNIPGVDRVTAVLTSHQDKDSSGAGQPPNLRVGRHPTGGTAKVALPGVKDVIAVASGKGGVGKSTVASNLAVAMARRGIRTGLLDADIHGPSLPMMMGVSARPESPDGNTIRPLTVHGVVMMSIGLLLPRDEAVIWRGPMMMGALQQMLQQVEWGELDVLIVDLPPGTGDVQLTLCQRFTLRGAVIVCTPQDVALLDARRAIAMFNKLNAPVLGLIENMSFFDCPHCGERSDLFGSGGARRAAGELRIPFLGQIPIDISVRAAGDAGRPAVMDDERLAGFFDSISDLLI